MPRNMSFFMTTDAILQRKKDVTRRFGWWNLKAGTRLQAVRKAQGIKKGEKIERLVLIEVVSVRSEPLNAITQGDVIREGFPNFSPQDFIDMLVRHYKTSPNAMVNRIEFKYIEDEE